MFDIRSNSWGQFLLFEKSEEPKETFQNSSTFIKRLAPTETFLNPDYQPTKPAFIPGVEIFTPKSILLFGGSIVKTLDDYMKKYPQLGEGWKAFYPMGVPGESIADLTNRIASIDVKTLPTAPYATMIWMNGTAAAAASSQEITTLIDTTKKKFSNIPLIVTSVLSETNVDNKKVNTLLKSLMTSKPFRYTYCNETISPSLFPDGVNPEVDMYEKIIPCMLPLLISNVTPPVPPGYKPATPKTIPGIEQFPPGSILIYGDSITKIMGGYLTSKLNFPQWKAIETSGVGGNRFAHIIKRMQEAPPTSPKALVLWIGTNNTDLPPPEAEIATMFDTAKKIYPNAKIFSWNILPRVGRDVGPMNAAIKKAADARGIQFITCGNDADLTKMSDGLHPSLPIYEKVIPCMLQTVVSSMVTTVNIPGKVSEVLPGGKARVNYTDPSGKRRLPVVALNARKGETVAVTIQNKAPYGLVSIAKVGGGSNTPPQAPTPKPAPKPTPAPTPAPSTMKVNGRVSEVMGADMLRLRYTDPSAKIRMPTVKKTKHGMKKGDMVTITVQNKAPYGILSVVKSK
ncbi:hypothetical protein MT325_M638R [Paramecium bursaria chlorella virus MT325]|uniref:Uncharacterized protein M638R n=1 Tax=Paramecium bursaria Chlorella virus MT325 TaxID=346932 RepID=A7IV18_PBCVM|nr:hypothetical protein MT325_M638R [Paramecium bursaria chlorella virus MT325]